MAEPFTIYKLTILSMLDMADFPLANTQFSEFFLDQGYTDYFQVQLALNDLVDAGLIRPEPTYGNTHYRITPAGEGTLALFRDKLTEDIRQDAKAYLGKNRIKLRAATSATSDYYRTTEQDYAVRCRFQEHGRDVIDLTLRVKEEEQAIAICRNWREQKEEFYAHLMDILLK